MRMGSILKGSLVKNLASVAEKSGARWCTYGVKGLRFKSTSTSDDEISHFQELAPTWWDVNGPQRILHLMNNARMDFVQNTIRKSVRVEGPETYIPGFDQSQFLPPYVARNIDHELNIEIDKNLLENKLSVLDIGCGGGILSESLARLSNVEHVTGIDLTAECVEIAKNHALCDPALENKLDYEFKNLEDVEGTYDIVTCFEMLEHVDVPSEILRHAWLKLKPNGILFLSTINRDFVSWFTTIFMGEYVLNIVPKGTHHLSKYIKATEIHEWFQNNEAGKHKILDTKGTMYLPLKGWVEHECSDVGNYFMAIKKTS